MLPRHYANVVSTAALFIALGGTGYAATQLGRNTVGPAQLKRNSVGRSEIRSHAVGQSELARRSVTRRGIRKGAVGSAAIATASVGSTEIAPGSVQAAQLALPAPTLIQSDATQAADVGDGYELVSTAGQVDKVAADSTLSVAWSGVAKASMLACVFQLRVDGQPAGRGAEVYVGGLQSVSVDSLFAGLPVGGHTIEIWARTVGGASYPCTINPPGVGVTENVAVEEVVR